MPESALYKTFFTLLLAVGGIGGLLFLMKKLARRGKSSGENVDLRVVSKLTLQPKNSIFVVKAGDRTLLLGASDRNISTLADLTDENNGKKTPRAEDFTLNKNIKPEQLKALTKSQSKNNQNDLSFASFLKSTLSK